MEGKSKMEKPETMAILGTQDTGRRQTNKKLKNQQSKKQSKAQHNTTHKTKKTSNTDPNKTRG